MTTTALDLPVADPHCGRWSDEFLDLEVGARSWKVRWGRYDAFGTPAYWVDQTVRHGYGGRLRSLATNSDLESELVFCVLGGFGVTAEAAIAAHTAIMPLLTSCDEPCAEVIEAVLRTPFHDGGKYRFPRQRAHRVALALRDLRSGPIPTDAEALRRRLLLISGIGPKTSAWIVRNHTGSDMVAIVDIWLVRALAHNGVFPPDWDVRRDYARYEAAFLMYAGLGQVRPAALDLCVWEQARHAGHQAFSRVK